MTAVWKMTSDDKRRGVDIPGLFCRYCAKNPVIDKTFFNKTKEYTTVVICIDYIRIEEYTVDVGLKRLLSCLC